MKNALLAHLKGKKVTLKYIGKNPTRVRTTRTGEKVDIKQNDELEFEGVQAASLLKGYSHLFSITKGIEEDKKVTEEKMKKVERRATENKKTEKIKAKATK